MGVRRGRLRNRRPQGRGNVADGFEEAPVIEPVDPFEDGELDGFDVSPARAVGSPGPCRER